VFLAPAWFLRVSAWVLIGFAWAFTVCGLRKKERNFIIAPTVFFLFVFFEKRRSKLNKEVRKEANTQRQHKQANKQQKNK
jgi:hypothetical protein